MVDEETALAVWRDMKAIPAMVDRVRSGASGEPLTYRVMILAKNLTGRQVAEIIQVANSHDTEVSINMLGSQPVVVVG